MGGCRRCFNKWSPLNPYIHKTDQTLVFNQSYAVYFAEIIRDVLINQRNFLLKNSIYLLCEKVEYKLNSLPYPGKIIDRSRVVYIFAFKRELISARTLRPSPCRHGRPRVPRQNSFYRYDLRTKKKSPIWFVLAIPE